MLTALLPDMPAPWAWKALLIMAAWVIGMEWS